MKKNISINISGIIFHIEEDGYETLRKYLDSINRYFSNFEDSSEILADIEGRIAEIFLAKLNEGKQVITAEDVNALMTTMGNVNDFKAAEEQEFASTESAKSEQKRTTTASAATKRLFRDQKRKILGGVCAGLAHYFSIDPVWTRVIMALLFFGYGGGLILYIILWIVLPASNELEEETSVKKMFRNPDQKVLGGVASGVASFFGVDVVIIRLLFVVFTFAGGTGLILYIILWISLPEAKTITEKMEMQGEPVTLTNIESSVKKSLNEKDNQEESTLAKIILFPFRILGMILNGMASVLGPLVRVFVDVLRVASGIIIILIGFTFILSLLFAAGAAAGIFSSSPLLWGDLHLSGLSLPLDAMRNAFPGWTLTAAFLVAFVPAIFIFLLGISIVAKKIVFNAMVGWALFVLFFVSIAFLSINVPRFIFSFKEDGEYKVEKTFEFNGKMPVFKINEVGLDDYDVTNLKIKGYEGTNLKLVEHFEAQGNTRKIAGENAQMVDYNVVQQDSVLIFDSNITFKKDSKFRAQRLDMELFIPYHQKFTFDKELWRLINNYNGHNYRYNGYQYYDYYDTDNQIWEVTEDGLNCLSCQKKEINGESDMNRPSGSGLGTEDQFGLENFNGVDLNGIFRVKIQKSDNYAVRLDDESSNRKRYNVYLDGETLVIDYDNKSEKFWKRNFVSGEEIKITITTPQLKEVNVRGAGKVDVIGFDEEDMEIKLLGAIVANFEISARNLNADITGASSLELNGDGDFLDANITGASSLKAYRYEVERAVVEAHGASSAKVNVTQSLEITKGIASTISHRGDPEIIKRDY